MLPEINEEYTDFVLTYVKVHGNGLDSIVRKLHLNDDKSVLSADLHMDLIQSFSDKFPDADLAELDDTVRWILIVSYAKLKENNIWMKNLHQWVLTVM